MIKRIGSFAGIPKMMGKIADDRLRGAKAIADELGESERQVRYGIDRGRIPAVKEGGVWCASRELLRERCRAKMRGATNNGAK
jgi:hypothetical protein